MFEDTTGGRKFLRGLRELNNRMLQISTARESARLIRAMGPDGLHEESGDSDQDDDDRGDEDQQPAGSSVHVSRAPVSTSSSVQVVGVVRNVKSVRLV